MGFDGGGDRGFDSGFDRGKVYASRGSNIPAGYKKPVVDRCFVSAGRSLRTDYGYESAYQDGLEIPSGRKAQKSAALKPSLQQMPQRVLIVDDHEDNLMLARYIVEEEGHTVAAILSGHDAVESAITFRPDLILLDILLDNISGLDIFRQLKQYEQFERTPVVAVSAITQLSIRQEAIAIGFADYLTKPYHIEDLCQILEKHCSAGRLQTTDASSAS